MIDKYITVLGQTTSYYNCSITKHRKFKIKKRISKRRLIQKYKLKIKLEFIKYYKYFDRKLYNILYNHIKNNK